MADLDVTEILFDPDFMDTGLVCQRATQVVGDDGMAVNTTSSTPFAGVVTSDAGDVLERIASGERVKGSITIHTVFPLSDGDAGQTADVVTWRGRNYTVTNVNDYLHFGAGFVCATCEPIPLAG
ncbi:hypothetical protein [Chitiniphilus eburneus]|uniref:Head-tail adaptor protein n=1 Tax=Chitiniphilus eburneus TaxID=2571148 RepID=A0A4U0Q3D6_9NEIS|nr:hypothetical protein [Chitiniphilus eburneus]TJZ75583.1 hypothetical protein FAZ21_06615 [Chitiniphilus eburneus]